MLIGIKTEVPLLWLDCEVREGCRPLRSEGSTTVNLLYRVLVQYPPERFLEGGSCRMCYILRIIPISTTGRTLKCDWPAIAGLL